MSNNWDIEVLSDILIMNPVITTNSKGKYPFIEMSDLEPSQKFVEPKGFRESKGLTKFAEGDTLFAKITPCLENGKIAQAQNIKNNIGVGSTEFFVFRGKNNRTDNNYIYYLLNWYPIKEFAIRNMTGSAGHQRVPSDVFDIISLPIPPYGITQKIGCLLTSLDQKIHLLHQQNKTLENMAQTLFKHWFVDFEFPDENGNPYKSSGGVMEASELGEIPKGWRLGSVQDFIIVKRGGSPRPIKDYIVKEGFSWVKISDATSCISPFLFNTKEFIKKEGLKKTVHLKKGSLILSNSATPGLPKILKLDACIHDGWLYFPEIKDFSQEYLYLFFLHNRERFIQQGNGSVFTNLKTDILKEFPLVRANENLHKKFDQIISDVFGKIEINSEQIQTLTNLRDTILPKLMSGEIEVK